MDACRFDALVSRFAARSSRRGALLGGALAGVLASETAGVRRSRAAEEATPAATPRVLRPGAANARVAAVGADLAVTLDREALVKQFEDGTPVESTELENVDGAWFLVRRGGCGGEGNCVVERAPVVFDASGVVMLDNADDAVSEKCEGNPCSNCTILPYGSGCRCDNPTSGRCNHTVSRVEPGLWTELAS